MFTFHPLSDDTRHRLRAGGLDPDAVAGLVRAAVAEDLMGGVWKSSTAEVPLQKSAVMAARISGEIASPSTIGRLA